jgi:TetR/AcrR family transcriptional regulator, transcriptional repressor for nem operon
MNDTREYIIDQAYSLFITKSYEAVSISEISKAIGFTKGALYHHFTNKEELFRAVIDKYLLITEISIPTDDLSLAQFMEESLKKAEEIVRNILGEKPAYIPINYFALLIDAFRHYPGFAEEKGQYIGIEINRIKSVLDNAIKRGEIRKDIDTGIMATNYFSIAIGLTTNLLNNSSPQKTLEFLREQYKELYKVLKI